MIGFYESNWSVKLIVSRTISREILGSTAAITLVSVSIFLSHVFVRYITYVASGKYSVHFLLQMMGLEVPHLLGLLLPLSFYLAVILSYGRMQVDNELTIWLGSGVSQGRLTRLTLLLAGGLSVLVAVLALWISPWILSERLNVRQMASSSAVISLLNPGQFHRFSGAQKVLYVHSFDQKTQQANTLFLAQKMKGTDTWEVMTAESAQVELDENSPDRFVRLTKGHRYQGEPGERNFRVIDFGEYGIRVPNKELSPSNDPRTIPTKTLISESGWASLANQAEWQWRLSIPLSVFVLGLLALPLSRLRPRQGRYAKLLPAIFIYICYANLMFVGRDWIKSGTVDPWIGMWWIHALALILALLLAYFPRMAQQLKRWRASQ